ncbi:hypothetical protein [Duganella sp. BuS-21]|uniref:hypothetical protein n=1 Tax=Duganella sp. BuS-21 TaxID=2943848 RepID=UPI0035A6F09B
MREISTQEMDVVTGGGYGSQWVKRQADDDMAGVVRQVRWGVAPPPAVDHSTPTVSNPVAVTDGTQSPPPLFNWRFWQGFGERHGVRKHVGNSK